MLSARAANTLHYLVRIDHRDDVEKLAYERHVQQRRTVALTICVKWNILIDGAVKFFDVHSAHRQVFISFEPVTPVELTAFYVKSSCA